jgi:hypothetical protein
MLLPFELEQELKALGWNQSQRKRAESNPDLAWSWVKAAKASYGIREPGAFAWVGFKDGAQPVEPRLDGWTGYTFRRGSHSGMYVRDPNGFDRLPPGYEPPTEKAS